MQKKHLTKSHIRLCYAINKVGIQGTAIHGTTNIIFNDEKLKVFLSIIRKDKELKSSWTPFHCHCVPV